MSPWLQEKYQKGVLLFSKALVGSTGVAVAAPEAFSVSTFALPEETGGVLRTGGHCLHPIVKQMFVCLAGMWDIDLGDTKGTLKK